MTLSGEHFDTLYAKSDDPYGFGDRWYEWRKRGLTLAALVRPSYRRAFEPGCSLGFLTVGLAQRCDEVVAWDVAEAAVASARERCAELPGVTVEHGTVPDEFPEGPFDLVVVSEIAYYFDDDALAKLVARTVDALEPGGTLLLCHWRRDAPHPQTAESAHAAFLGADGLELQSRYLDDDFVLDVVVRIPPARRSVAEEDGIV